MSHTAPSLIVDAFGHETQMSPRLGRDGCGDLLVLPFHATLSKKRTTAYPGVLTEPHTYVYAYMPTSCAREHIPNPRVHTCMGATFRM